MATNSQILKRPHKGYFEDAQVQKITSISDQTGTPRFTSVAHAMINGDDIQMISFQTSTGITDPDENPKYYLDVIDYSGDLPESGNGITVFDVNEFEFAADNFNYAGNGLGVYAKDLFRSLWVAAFNPVIYRFWRSDDKITSIVNNGGKIRAVFETFASGSFPSGREVFIRDNYKHDAIFTVNTASGSPATVDFNEDFIQAKDFAHSVINAINAEYRLEVDVFNENDVKLTVKPLIYQSPQDGRIVVDIQKVLTARMNFATLSTLATDKPVAGEIHIERGRFQSFYIQTLEKWTGSSESLVSDEAKFTGFAVAATLDSGGRFGSNMADFVPNASRSVKAKFLQKLARPTIWREYPWTIMFIQDNSSSLVAEIEWRDATESVTLTRSQSVLQARYVGRYSISIDDIPDSAVTANVHLEGGGAKISEELICDVADACNNPLMIEWATSPGGDSYWLFDINYLRTVSADGQVVVERPITDMQNQQILQRNLGSGREVEIEGVARGVSADNYEALTEILTSPLVNLLLDSGNKNFRRVSVTVTSTKIGREVEPDFLDFIISFKIPKRMAQK